MIGKGVIGTEKNLVNVRGGRGKAADGGSKLSQRLRVKSINKVLEGLKMDKNGDPGNGKLHRHSGISKDRAKTWH